MRVALVLLVVFLAGCTVVQVGSATPASSTATTTYVVSHDQVPVIPEPERPVLDTLTQAEKDEFGRMSPGLQQKLSGNDKKLMTYAKQLSVSIETFNNWARTQNDLHKEKK